MTKQYYAGTYQDVDGSVLQVVDDVDSMSCEMLASPGLIRMDDSETCKVSTMLCWAFELAGQFNCHHVEVNCEQGHGSYKWLKY